MNPFMRCLLLACVTLIGACTAVGVVSTGDPLTKLNDAAVLYGRKDRPLPAEKLIREAIAIYQREDDAHGLGIAYREYGDLLRSAAVINWESEYRRDGFLDRSINFDNRLEKANEFYRKALDSLELGAKQRESTGRYDALSNVYYNMAWAHLALGETSQVCEDFDHALGAYMENTRRNPAAKPMHSPAFGSAAEEIAYRKRQAGCPSP
jgi:tetratricopeptide (TPR) repeat protein